MIDIIPHIQYLVCKHDCVILPGWGAFIASHVAASVDGSMMMPPTRVIGFNPDVNHNDGLLATSVARRENVSYETARNAVDTAVSRLRALYDAAGQLSVPRVGTLRRDSDGAVSFIPVSGVGSLAAVMYRGLQPVEIAAEAPAVDAGRKVAALSGLRAFGKVAAAVAVLIGLGITLTTPITVSNMEANYASVPAPTVTAAKSVTLPQITPISEGRLYAVIPDSATTTATVADAAVRHAESDRFFLIVSSHANRAEAQTFIDRRPGENLSILERDGRFRVYAASGATFEQAKALTADADFAGRHPNAWVYRK